MTDKIMQVLKSNTTINLCEGCVNRIAVCGATSIVFGRGVGNDNVVACDRYRSLMRKTDKCEIRVIAYRGKTGGFAIEERDLWRLEIGGVDGKLMQLGDKHTQQNANEIAKHWNTVTGFKVTQYKTEYKTTSELIKL